MLQVASLPPVEATRHLVPLVERAVQAYHQGAKDVAEQLCLDVLELAPDRPGALSVLYSIRKEQGKTNIVRRLRRFRRFFLIPDAGAGPCGQALLKSAKSA